VRPAWLSSRHPKPKKKQCLGRANHNTSFDAPLPCDEPRRQLNGGTAVLEILLQSLKTALRQNFR